MEGSRWRAKTTTTNAQEDGRGGAGVAPPEDDGDAMGDDAQESGMEAAGVAPPESDGDAAGDDAREGGMEAAGVAPRKDGRSAAGDKCQSVPLRPPKPPHHPAG